MAKLLLDTHAWIWSCDAPARLGPGAAAAMRAADSELLLSSISLWEILVLVRKGRITLAPDPRGWIRQSLAAMPVRVVALTGDMALESELLPGYSGQDPGDRFIIATALAEGASIVTADRAIRRYAEVDTLW